MIQDLLWSSHKLFWLVVLYFIQGLPYGFQITFLPIFLRANGASLTQVSLMRVLNLPWMLKLMWAPLVSSCQSIQRPLTLSLAGLTLIYTAIAFIHINSIWLLSGALLLMNVLISVQDIAVDSLAIQTLTKEELGVGNTIQVVTYKLGAILGGGVLVWTSQFCSWTLLMFSIGLFYLVMAFLVHIRLHIPYTNSTVCAITTNSVDNAECRDNHFQQTGKSLTEQPEQYQCRKRKSSEQQVGQYFYSVRASNQPLHQGEIVTHSNTLKSPKTCRYFLRSMKADPMSDCSADSQQTDRLYKSNSFNSRKKIHVMSCSTMVKQSTDYEPCIEREEFHTVKADRVPKHDIGRLVTPECDEGTSASEGEECTTFGLKYVKNIFSIPNTGEQGVVSILPLYLLDVNISTNQATVCTGVIGQWISIGGSLLGGWMLRLKHTNRHPCVKLLVCLCLSRFVFEAALTTMIQTKWLSYNLGLILFCLPLYVIMLTGGAITTATFTLMMQTSQHAPHHSIQTMHHTAMATAEVFGKVLFTSLAGLLVDNVGYTAGFYTFTILSLLPLYPLSRMTEM